MNMELNHRHLPSGASIIATPLRSLNVDIANNGLLPEGPICGIHFEQNGLVTIVIGSCAYDRGYITSYLASVVAAGLGIPLSRLRVYYSGTLPAVRLTPRPVIGTQRPNEMGLPIIAKMAERIDSLCRAVIARGQSALTATFGWPAADIVFDPKTGCFVTRDERIDLLELVRMLRRAN
jgi:hypothetical protein